MSRYIGPKNRLARREGADLGLKTTGSKAHASLLRRLNIFPGMHGVKRRKKSSGFSLQLREKQKMKRIYGISERQSRNYFKKALKKKGSTGETLLSILETRLDNALYRLNLVPTRPLGRQLIVHGHVLINGKKLTIPSYLVKVNDVISLTAKGAGIPAVSSLLKEKNLNTPEWLSKKGPAGKIVSLPKREEIGDNIDEQLIVEYYKR